VEDNLDVLSSLIRIPNGIVTVKTNKKQVL
jgi:hypothetical protein